MLLKPKTIAKRSGMILLIVVAFLSMFLVVGTTYLLVADSIRRTSDFDLNATDKRSDYALMPDIDPRYMFNFALGQILYDVADPIAFDGTGKILTTNSALRGHSLARDIYGGYISGSVNDRPFQGMGKNGVELDYVNYNVFGLTTNGVGVRDPEKGVRGSPPVYSRWNPPYSYPDKNHTYLGKYGVLKVSGKINNDSNRITNVVGEINELRTGMLIDFVPGGDIDAAQVIAAHPSTPFFISAIDSSDPANVIISLSQSYLLNPIITPTTVRNFSIVSLIPSFQRDPITWLPATWGPRTADNNFVDDPNLRKTVRPRPFDQLTATELNTFTGPGAGSFPSPTDPGFIVALNSMISNNKIFPYPEADGGDVKNLEGYPGGNDSIWIDAGFPVMTTPDGRKYKALIAPLILDLDGRINLNVAGNLMERKPDPQPDPNLKDPFYHYYNGDHASNQGWGRWEINPKKLIENYAGGSAAGSPYNPLFITQSPFPPPMGPMVNPVAENEFLRLLSFTVPSIENGTTGITNPPTVPRPPNSTKSASLNSTYAVDNQWTTFGRFYQSKYLPINGTPPPVTNFLTNIPHSYAQVDFNGAGDFVPAGPNGIPPKTWGPASVKPNFVNASGFPTLLNAQGVKQDFGNGQASERLLDGNNSNLNYHARNYNPYRTQSNANGISTVFPVSETASILRWQGKGEPYSKSQLAQLLPKSLGLDMPYDVSSADAIFRQRIRNMVTTLSADLDRPSMVPIIPDTNAHTLRFGDFLFPERTVSVTIPNAALMPPVMPPPMPPIKGYNPIGDTITANPNLTSPALKMNLSRYLTPFPNLVQDNTTDRTNYIDYASNSAIFLKAKDDRTNFATELFDALRNVTGIIKYESVITNPAFAGDLLEIKKSNRWLAQLAANIVDFIDADDFNTVFNWNIADAKDIVFGVELPRVVINEVYNMAQNDSGDMFMNNTKATMSTHLFTAVELMNPLPPDGSYVVGPGGHNAVLQFKNGAGTEYQNYKLVLCKQSQISGQINAVNGNYFNNTGSHDFNGTNIAMDSNNPSMMNPAVMDKAILDNWTDPINMPMPNMVPTTWYLNPGGYMVITDNTTLRMEADPQINTPINTTIKTPKLKLKIINKDQDPNDDNAPEVMLQKLVYPGMPHNDFDPMTNMLTDGTKPYNPYITIDVFSKRKMHDLRKYDKLNALNPVVTTSSSKGRKSPFLDSSSMDIFDFSKNMYNGNNTVNQGGGMPGAQHTMGQPNSNAQNPLPWLAHLDRQLINPLELIHASTVKPHELTQTANRWDIAFNQKCLHPTTNMPVINQITNVPYFFPTLTKYPYAHNWPWFDENTRLYRFLEAVGVSPLQAGEAMHGRALGKVNVNTMHSEEVFQAIADAKPAGDTTGPNNFTVTEVNTAFKKLTGDATLSYSDQRPILSFGQANYTDGMGVKNGLNKSLMGYQVANNKPYENFLDNLTPDPNNPPNPLFPSTGTNVATYARKELLTKIGNSVTTKSNVFAVWITTGYFEVRDDSTQPPKLGAEIGKADGINIRHRMFAIVDRTNMKAGDITYRTTGGVNNTTSFGFNTTVNKNPDNSYTLATSPSWVPVSVPPPVPPTPTSPHFIFTHPVTKVESIITNAFAGMILVLNPNTDYEETVQLEVVGGGLGFYVRKEHYPVRTATANPQVFNSINNIYSIINRGNPGPWVGYDRTKDRDVVPYAEIIE